MNQKFDTLYARNSNGGIVQWYAEVQNDNNIINIKLVYGQYDGNQTIKYERDIKGKNIGKSNETNPWEQAVSQVESKYNRQKDKGYLSLEEIKTLDVLPSKFKDLNDVGDELYALINSKLPKYRKDASGNIKPMKAQQYYKTTKKPVIIGEVEYSDYKYAYMANPYIKKNPKHLTTKFPCMAQPKINGVRCTIRLEDNRVVLTSKEGKIYTVAQINDFLNINNDLFLIEGKEIILDGELYIHRELLQDIRSAVVKPNLSTPLVKFVLFDLAIEGKSNIERWEMIKTHIKPKLQQHINCPIEIIRTTKANNDADAQAVTDLFIEQGYEGTIFRSFDAPYGFGTRRVNMTKLKRVEDDEFTIVDIVPQDKDGTKGNYSCVTKDGAVFDVTPKGDDAFKRELLANKSNYIGKKLTCVFYEYTDAGIPFHIINNLIRDYE